MEEQEQDARVVAQIMHDMHKYATENMSELARKGGPISKLPLQVRQYLAQECSQIVTEHLYKGCTHIPFDEFKGCDMTIAILNLYQVLSLAIQYGESQIFDIMKKLGESMGAAMESKLITGILTDVELYSREQNLTLRDIVTVVGPVMFASYRALVPTDYIVTYYEQSAAERREAGYTGGVDPVRRIQYMCVILNNNGEKNSDVLRQCSAIATGPDFRNMDHVKAFTKDMNPQLYALMQGDGGLAGSDPQAMWVEQQKALIDAELKVASEKKKKNAPRARCLACGEKIKGIPQRCSACKETYYCSRDCQKANWQAHKKDCVKKK